MDIQLTPNQRTALGILLLPLCLFLIYRLWRLEGRSKTPNPAQARKILLMMTGFIGGDLILLGLLPILNLLYARILLQLSVLSVIRFLLAFSIDSGRRIIAFGARKPVSSTFPISMRMLLALNTALTLVLIYGMYIEPFNLGVTTVQIPAPAQVDGRPLRIVHLSDLHISGITPRETALLKQVAALQPDLILLTGDYIFIDRVLDPDAQVMARQVLSQMQAPLGVYAVASISIDPSPNTGTEQVFASLDNIRFLWDEAVQLEGIPIYLLGITDTWDVGDDAIRMQALKASLPTDTYTILMYHQPEMVTYASKAGIDLQLSGHTHGGQVRIPGFGALLQLSSAYEPNYDMGRYTVGSTSLYVTRGVGLEGVGYPPVRINCPPEVVLLELGR